MQTNLLAHEGAPFRPMRERLGATFAAYLERANTRLQLRRLSMLDDHLLKDMGITRADLRGLGL